MVVVSLFFSLAIPICKFSNFGKVPCLFLPIYFARSLSSIFFSGLLLFLFV